MNPVINRKPIITERLTVRAIEPEDWAAVRAIWEDFNKTEYRIYDTPKNTDADDVKRRIFRWAEATHSGNAHVFFAVCLEGAVIGFISLNARNEGYELGYGFLSEHHGKGYARESLSAVFDYARHLGAKKIFAGTALKNLPSERLLEHLGFELVGTENVSFYKDSSFEGGIFEKEL